MTAKNAFATSILGGLSVLSLGILLVACATVSQVASGPAPERESVQALMHEWDAVEKEYGRPPEAFRKQYARALSTVVNSLAETARERARQ